MDDTTDTVGEAIARFRAALTMREAYEHDMSQLLACFVQSDAAYAQSEHEH